MNTTRRGFLRTTSAGAIGACAAASGWGAPGASVKNVYRAAVIGRTGGGDYGHGYDRIFAGLNNVVVEAVADRDAAGGKQAAERAGAKRRYVDYREMLEREKPDLVSIAARHPDCHVEMALAAIESGASVFIEKPMTETAAEADRIIAGAEQRGVKIAVAHNRRWSVEFAQVKPLVDQGLIGQVREVRIQGKQDSRSGGEDLIVLGTHDFDLMRLYFGDPRWCFASVTSGGRDVTRAQVRRGQEPLLVAGDTIHAMFSFPQEVMVYWSSVKRSDHWNSRFSKREKWAFEIYGTKGIIAYQSGLEFAWLDSPFLARLEQTPWKQLPGPADWNLPEHAKHPIKSLIHAIETGTQPVCSGYDGRWAIEMVSAVYQSAKDKARVSLPLAFRENPLLQFS